MMTTRRTFARMFGQALLGSALALGMTAKAKDYGVGKTWVADTENFIVVQDGAHKVMFIQETILLPLPSRDKFVVPIFHLCQPKQP